MLIGGKRYVDILAGGAPVTRSPGELSHSELLQRILTDAPRFHRSDETSDQTFYRSALPEAEKSRLQSLRGKQNWGITHTFARYLLKTISPGMRTLETGSGISTLV